MVWAIQSHTMQLSHAPQHNQVRYLATSQDNQVRHLATSHHNQVPHLVVQAGNCPPRGRQSTRVTVNHTSFPIVPKLVSRTSYQKWPTARLGLDRKSGIVVSQVSRHRFVRCNGSIDNYSHDAYLVDVSYGWTSARSQVHVLCRSRGGILCHRSRFIASAAEGPKIHH